VCCSVYLTPDPVRVGQEGLEYSDLSPLTSEDIDPVCSEPRGFGAVGGLEERKEG
jgi:hypothetical protein